MINAQHVLIDQYQNFLVIHYLLLNLQHQLEKHQHVLQLVKLKNNYLQKILNICCINKISC
eukprot:UN06829